MRKKITAALNLVEKTLTAAVACLLIIVAIMVCWSVFARYVLKTGTYWIEEFSTTAMMWIGLLGAAACVWPGSHMSLELVVKRLPAKARRVVEVMIELIVAAFAIFLLAKGVVMTESFMTSRMTSLPFPIGVSYLALPVAGGFMILFALVRAVLKIMAPNPAEKGADSNA
jgi:TRAP-type C4-dicarboxylate transport system permease small subunit